MGSFVTVNRIKLHYAEKGSGQPLILLHGNGGDLDTFRDQLDAFSPFYRVFALDSRAHGRSGGEAEGLTYRQMAADVAAFCTQLALPPVRVFGWSDGGIVGLLLALHHAPLVRALAVSGANLWTDEKVFSREDLESMRSVVAAGSRASPREKALTRLMLTQPQLTYEDLTLGVKCPTLVMAGDRDLIRVEHTLGIFRAILGADLALFPHADHGYFLSDPGPFHQVLSAFLSRN